MKMFILEFNSNDLVQHGMNFLTDKNFYENVYLRKLVQVIRLV